MIVIKNLSFDYVTFEKASGLKGTIEDLFHRKPQYVKALKNINLNIEDGSLIGLIGPNGAGKTTLTKLLTGIISPSSGSVNIDTFIPMQRKNELLKEIGVLFGQKSQLSWDLPAIDTLNMLASIYSLEENRFKKRLKELTKMLNAENLINKPVRKLSLGQRVKCDLICSLIHEPKYLFLDEPTLGLDLMTQESIYEFLREENKRNKTTIIITSHNIRDIEALAQRLIILANGEIIFDDKLEKLPINISTDDHFIVKYLVNNEPDSKNISENDLKKFLQTLSANQIISLTREGINLEEIIWEIYKKVK